MQSATATEISITISSEIKNAKCSCYVWSSIVHTQAVAGQDALDGGEMVSSIPRLSADYRLHTSTSRLRRPRVA